MIRLLVLEGWNSYRREVIPAEAPVIQVEECRRAFYAGCIHLFYAVLGIMDPGTEPTAGDLAQMTAIEGELKAYGAEMAALADRMEREAANSLKK
jgi:hypothetical protein